MDSPQRSAAGCLPARKIRPQSSKRLGERLLALGHEGVAEQHEILCRFVRGDIGVVQLFEELTQWFSDYMENCQAAAMDELHAAA
ncbi:hypothetical protein [Sorangium sp. So ce128]|uniref:hypothetical protein n=1 Tax=Sorangium sp. So ce128 TaxID=3133281 RepID=UPI003F613C96